MCIYACVMVITQSTTVFITCGPVHWRGQLVMHHVYIMFKFQQNVSLSQRNLKGVSIDLKYNNSDLSGNTLEFKTLPTRPRSHRYVLLYIFPIESVKICRFKTFWMSIFARGTLLVFRCFNIATFLKC